jgi:hypothetical protein
LAIPIFKRNPRRFKEIRLLRLALVPFLFKSPLLLEHSISRQILSLAFPASVPLLWDQHSA